MITSERPPWYRHGDIDKPVALKTRKVADTLFAEIVSGVHCYGTLLPSERELAERYGRSRYTIRTALSHLEHFGVIKRRAGSGSVVCYPPPNDNALGRTEQTQQANIMELGEICENTSPLELGVVRSIVEPEIARLAVLNMTSRDIQRLNAIQDELELVSHDGERFSELDDELRMQIAKGTHNPLLISIYSLINNVSRDAGWAVQRRHALTPARIKQNCLQNRSLCEAIKNRDIESAVEYLKYSLAEFHQDLMRGA